MAFERSGLLWAVILTFGFFSCQQAGHGPDGRSGDTVSQPSSEKLRVLTTIAPIYCFTKNVAGDAAFVENLLPPGAEPHEYSLSPQDAIKAAEAQVIIKNGVNLETWLNKLLFSAGEMSGSAEQKPVVADTSRGVELIDNDPHIWLSPKNALVQVKNIMDVLIKADPENSSAYKENARQYIKRLEALDREMSGTINTFKRKGFVSFHSAFIYFARDYGLKQVAVIQETPEAEPSPAHIVSVMNTIKAEGIRSIFSEPGITHKIVGSIAKDLDLRVYSLDTLETGTFSREWYEERMRANLSVLKEALN
jgi:zinc/manganese transport system substrate-binding protein